VDALRDIWPWAWPTVLLLALALGVAVGTRRYLGAGEHALTDPSWRRYGRWLAAVVLAGGVALWLTVTPVLPASVQALWDAVWPWAWPTLLAAAMFATARAISPWFERGLASRLAASAPDEVARVTVHRVALAILLGGSVGTLYLWASWVPMPAAVSDFLDRRVAGWVGASIALIAWVALGLFGTRHLVAFLGRRAARTTTELDDALVAALRRPLWFAVLVAGLAIFAGIAPLPPGLVRTVNLAISGAAVFLVVMFLASFVSDWMRRRSRTSTVLRTSGSVLRAAAKAGIYFIGILTVLSTVGIDVTPLLTSLGIGSLAIGLALQKTLEDFLAGLFLAADQPIRVGDYIRLGDDEEGEVLTIGWRTTRIRTRSDIQVIMPNSKLASSTIINRSRPTSEMSFTIPIGVDYDTDLDQAADIAIEVARDLQNHHPNGVPGFDPVVVFEAFGESSIDLRVWLRARDWERYFRLRDAFIRAVTLRYREAGINIPFPIRTLDLRPGVRFPLDLPSGDAPPPPPSAPPAAVHGA